MSDVDLDGFSDPWEHIRLLADPTRNAALVDMIVSLAPQRVVVEVGCGSGLLACVAAKAGAKKVYAVEPTPLWADARDLIAANGLESVVEVLPGRIQDVARREADLVFSELLNADPFLEEVLDAMEAAAAWLRPGGLVAPRRLRVWGALVRDGGSAKEARVARQQVAALGERFGLNVQPVHDLIADPGEYAYVTSSVSLASEPVLLWDIAVGTDQRPDDLETVMTATEAGPVGGAVVWFEADYADGVVLHNAPSGGGGHWGHLVSAWPDEIGVRGGESVDVSVEVDGGSVRVSRA